MSCYIHITLWSVTTCLSFLHIMTGNFYEDNTILLFPQLIIDVSVLIKGNSLKIPIIVILLKLDQCYEQPLKHQNSVFILTALLLLCSFDFLRKLRWCKIIGIVDYIISGVSKVIEIAPCIIVGVRSLRLLLIS